METVTSKEGTSIVFAVLTSNHGRTHLEFRRVPLDVAALVWMYNASGRPNAEDAIAQYSNGQAAV